MQGEIKNFIQNYMKIYTKIKWYKSNEAISKSEQIKLKFIPNFYKHRYVLNTIFNEDWVNK